MKKALLLLVALALIVFGSITFSSCAKSRSLDDAEVSLEYEETIYNGTEKTPTVSIKYKEEVIAIGFFDVSYSTNIEVGTAYVTVKGKADFTEWTGTAVLSFTIQKLDLADTVVSLSSTSYVYDGTAKRPSATVSYDGAALPTSDYNIEYSHNISIGTARVTVSALSENVTGSTQKSFEITMPSFDNAILELDSPSFVYNGKPQTPHVTVRIGSATVNESKYTITYTNNTNAGTATLTVAARAGVTEYSGSKSMNFTIEKAPLSTASVDLSQESYPYSGVQLFPQISPITIGDVVVPSGECNIEYINNINVGTGIIRITAKASSPNFTGSFDRTFAITKADLSNTTVTLEYSTAAYNALAITPSVSVFIGTNELPAKDFTVFYTNNVNVGTANIEVSSIFSNNLSGTKSTTFEITKRDISSGTITLSQSSLEFSGSGINPPISSLFVGTILVPNSEFNVNYTDNILVGTGTVTVTADSLNFEGEVSTTFEIVKASIENVRVTFASSVNYNGQPQTPTPSVIYGNAALVLDTDYSISFENNLSAGTATAILTALDTNFAGKKVVTFNIAPANLSGATITLSAYSFIFDNEHKTPDVDSVVLPTIGELLPSDYSVLYTNNLNAGTATVHISALTANFEGQITKTFTIERADLQNATLTLGGSSFVYNSFQHMPSVTVSYELSDVYIFDPADYYVSYENNINAGTATATVSSNHSNFTGTKTINFTIEKLSIQQVTITSPSNQTYLGVPLAPVPFIVYAGIPLTNGNDFTIHYENNLNVGLGAAIITATENSNYFGQAATYFHIVANNLANATVTIETSKFTFNNANHTPSIVVSLEGIPALDPSQYNVVYSNNKNAGKATITITPKTSNLISQKIAEFIIDKANLKDALLTLEETEFVYNYGAHEPAVTVEFLSDGYIPESFTVHSTNYSVAYINHVAVGRATVTVEARGSSQNFIGSISTYFTIKGNTVSVDSLTNLQTALSGANNSGVVLLDNIDCENANITIPSRITLSLGEYILTNVNLTNEGAITAAPTTPEALEFALNYANDVVLEDNIALIEDLVITATENRTLSLDLNGFSIDKGISFVANAAVLDVTITNSQENQSVIGDISSETALAWLCNDGKLIVTGDAGNIKLLGTTSFVTEKTNSNSQIDFTEVEFEAQDLAAYLIGNHVYTFTDCNFSGLQAVHAKSGVIVLDNCTLTANGAYTEPVFDEFDYTASGNALTLECSSGYAETLTVSIIGGTFESEYGYSIELIATTDDLPIDVYASISIVGCPTLLSTQALPVKTVDSSVISIEVDDRAMFTAAIEFADNIKLVGDIESFYEGAYQIFTISAENRSYNLNIDLNGHSMPQLNLVNYIISGTSYSSNALNIKIFNSNSDEDGVIGSISLTDFSYGIMIDGNEFVSVTLENITVEGYNSALYTPMVAQGATVSATDCKFIGNDVDYSVSIGAHLAADYSYSFTDCEFEGGSGIHIKSGTMTLADCVVSGYAEYSEPMYSANDAIVTGNALMVEPTVGYFETLDITIDGGTFTSANGYAICVQASADEGIPVENYAEVTVTDFPIVSSPSKDHPISDIDGKITYDSEPVEEE